MTGSIFEKDAPDEKEIELPETDVTRFRLSPAAKREAEFTFRRKRFFAPLFYSRLIGKKSGKKPNRMKLSIEMKKRYQ